ncbi:MAG TPA: substrate-binding domain-containing protein [bacterium]|nr:substrate-binding domain-containing protein [bacterium]
MTRGRGLGGGLWGGLILLIVTSPLFALDLNGTGVRGAQDLLDSCRKAYATLAPDVQVKYNPQDSRHGTAQWLGKGADFLVVHFPLIPSDEKQAADNLLYIPVGLNAAVVTYNLPGVPGGLRLTPQALLDIFCGKIKRWNNSNLRELNPGLPLPDLAITVFHRDDESSLFDLFPRYLQKLDDQWPMDDPGPDQRVKWPVGQGVSGNGELLERMRQTAGSLGVVDYLYAASRQLPAAELRNEVGVFTAPTAASLTAAVADFSDLPQDLKVAVDHPRDPGAYPLASFDWVLVRPRLPKGNHDFKKNQALARFLAWWLADGQTVESQADGVPLPERFLDKARAQVAAMEVGDPAAKP